MPRIDPSSSIATRGCFRAAFSSDKTYSDESLESSDSDRELDPPPEESCVSPASFFSDKFVNYLALSFVALDLVESEKVEQFLFCSED
mgnify:CR=1 FL=1